MSIFKHEPMRRTVTVTIEVDAELNRMPAPEAIRAAVMSGARLALPGDDLNVRAQWPSRVFDYRQGEAHGPRTH